jgi:hypothetical protein
MVMGASRAGFGRLGPLCSELHHAGSRFAWPLLVYASALPDPLTAKVERAA